MIELISKLQDCNAELCAMFFNYTGALQRDAQPQPVNELPLQNDKTESTQDPPSKPDLGLQVVQLSKQFDDLLSYLPLSMPDRDSQLQNILQLQERVLKGRQQVEQASREAREELECLQAIHGVLADDKLTAK